MNVSVFRLLVLGGMALAIAVQAPRVRAREQDRGRIVEVGGLRSQAPADWVEEPPDDPQCVKAYRLDPASDDEYYANVTIYALGKQEAGTAAGFVGSWKRRFLPPERKTMAQASKVETFKVGGALVTYLDVRGDYKGVPGEPTSRRENFRLLGAYLATPRGTYQICMFGPAGTVAVS